MPQKPVAIGEDFIPIGSDFEAVEPAMPPPDPSFLDSFHPLEDLASAGRGLIKGAGDVALGLGNMFVKGPTQAGIDAGIALGSQMATSPNRSADALMMAGEQISPIPASPIRKLMSGNPEQTAEGIGESLPYLLLAGAPFAKGKVKPFQIGPKVREIGADFTPRVTEINPPANRNQISGERSIELPSIEEATATLAPPKPRLRFNPKDGTYTNLDTGEVFNKFGKPVESATAPDLAAETKINAPEPVKVGADFEPVSAPVSVLPEFKGNRKGIVKRFIEDEEGSVPLPAYKSTVGELVDRKQNSPWLELANLPRAIKTTWDLSAPFRQGLGAITYKEFWTSFDDMFRAVGSEAGWNAVQKSIMDHPNFKRGVNSNGTPVKSFADVAGLHIGDMTDLTKREEAVMSTWAEYLPGVRRSNAAYTAFLNKTRADLFNRLVKEAGAETNLPLAKEIANYINISTGRGNLRNLEKVATELNSTLFSPRLMSSRLTMLNPNYYITANPFVRKKALRSLFGVAATGATLAALGKAAGAQVSLDPTSSEFGKIKIGNTRLDPYGGFQQYIVAATRFMKAMHRLHVQGKKSKFGQAPSDVALRFGRSKLQPLAGFAADMVSGKDFKGEPFNLTDSVKNLFIPMIVEDTMELAKENPELIPIVTPATALGMGSQTYQR